MNAAELKEHFSVLIEEVTEPLAQPETVIYPVAPQIYRVKPQSYEPSALTIGPLWRHIKLPGSLEIDKCKALCLKKVMERRQITSMEDLMDGLYFGNLDGLYFGNPCSTDALKVILTVDLVFLHELIICFTIERRNHYLWPFLRCEFTRLEWLTDLFKIGNQVPFHLLKVLFIQDETFNSCITRMINLFGLNITEELELSHSLHFLDCFYNAFLLNTENGAQSLAKSRYFKIPTASELNKVGIKFQISNTARIWDMKYNKTRFEFFLPHLFIQDRTEDILRNLVAHEQISKSRRPFTMYVAIMDWLVDTKEDLAILYKARVIDNATGSDDKLLSMLNNMTTNVSFNYENEWGQMMDDIWETYNSNWRTINVEF